MDKDDASPTDLELFARLEQSPPGTFKLFRGGIGVEENIGRHLTTMDEIEPRVGHALQSGCLIEVISIELQVIDLWLRIYLANTAGAVDKKKLQFGARLKSAKDVGFDTELARRIKEFNEGRIQSIHGYVVGTITYDRLASISHDGASILRDTAVFVVESSGEEVSCRDQIAARPGAMIVDAAGFVASVRKFARYRAFPR